MRGKFTIMSLVIDNDINDLYIYKYKNTYLIFFIKIKQIMLLKLTEMRPNQYLKAIYF